ncbi:MAG: hypothetical protein LC798_07470 [Chloroflexi bacterium]|nr:hypothetical protein [Chloroflexota bacterium]
MIVAVVGKGRDCPPDVERMAEEVGALIAEARQDLLTGGLGGVMAGAARGYAEEWVAGRAVALIPEGRDPVEPERYDVVLRTGLTEPGRNLVLASACDAMVALHGSHGTAQEVAVALDRGVPVWALDTPLWAPLGAWRVCLSDLPAILAGTSPLLGSELS